MATGGVARDVPILPTPELCEFLHSPCWLYPVIKFFAHAINEYGYTSDFAYSENIEQRKTKEKFRIIYETYCDLVGCILVAYCKDKQVDLTNAIKTAAMLCGDCKLVGVRQDVVNFIRAALNVDYFSYTMMCYNDMFEILCCHDMKKDIIQRDYEAEEMEKLLRFLHGMMELTFEEHKRVERHFSAGNMPIQLLIGPFLCCYGISLCHPSYDYDLNFSKLLYLMNESFKSTIDRIQLTEYLEQVWVMVKVDKKKVDKYIKELTSTTPPSSIDVKSEVKKMKTSLLKASLDQKLTISNKILSIKCDHQLQQAVEEVLTSDVLMTPAKLPKKPMLPEAVPQNPQPDPNPPQLDSDPSHPVKGVWPQGTIAQMVHLVKEYNHRITQNVAYLSIPYMIQTNVENMCELKTVVERYAKTFEDEWPETVSKVKSGGNRQRRYSHLPPEEIVDKSHQAIAELKSAYYKVK